MPRESATCAAPVHVDSIMSLGYDNPLYSRPFDHRGSFQTVLFSAWKGSLTPEQTAEVWLRQAGAVLRRLQGCPWPAACP